MDTPEGSGPWASSTRTPSRPASQKSTRSSRSARSRPSSRTTEETPLLARGDRSDDEEPAERTPAANSLLRSLSGSYTFSKKSSWRKRWPSILALFILCIVVIIIMLGFLATEGIQEYAMQAADFHPTRLSLDSLTETGVKVRIQGDFTMDASRVKKQSVRNLGRFGTWIAKEVESGPTHVDVYLPEYGNVYVGQAKVPSIKLNIRNGHTTHISFFTHLEPGSLHGIRNVANDWIEGRLGQVRIKGKAEIPLKSGLISIGKQTLEESMVFSGGDVPSFPHYNITKLNIREARDGDQGVGADVSIAVTNEYPVDLNVPPVAVDVLVDGCSGTKPIMVGTAETRRLFVQPHTDLQVNVTGRVEELPDALTKSCPNSEKSPLDSFIGNYMHGNDATIYINCCRFPDPKTPEWTRKLVKDIQVPIPFAGRDMGNLIKNFSLADVHFSLPDMFADPGTPEASPKISATIKVEVALPNEMNFPLNVTRIRADADVFYKGDKMGKLNLRKWQHANSTRVEAHGKEGPSLLIESAIDKAPLEILDEDLFSDIVQALIFGGKSVVLTVKAAVDVGMDTPLGDFAVREIPAEGVVPVKPIGHGDNKGHKGGEGGLSSISPKISNLSIIDTSRTSITLQALVNFTNPTKYSATVPFFNINILVNGTILGQATATDVEVHPGNNSNILIQAVYDPSTNSGDDGVATGKELLSQYISGYNTSITLQTHNGTIPAQPALGLLLSRFPITLQTPKLHPPPSPDDDDEDPSGPDDPDDDDGDEEEGQPHFIRDATMHLISSTAQFVLASPLSSTTLYITNLNATAFYEGQPSGNILYDLPFAVPPGLSQTPRLPVNWSLGSVGYGAIRKALGGELKLSAYADVSVRIGEWRGDIWFKGGSIGAKVRL